MRPELSPETKRELAEIARRRLRIETLEVRKCDRMDFQEIFVGSLADALEDAFIAGLVDRAKHSEYQTAV